MKMVFDEQTAWKSKIELGLSWRICLQYVVIFSVIHLLQTTLDVSQSLCTNDGI